MLDDCESLPLKEVSGKLHSVTTVQSRCTILLWD
jgi:hypothetical protein